MGFNNRTLGRHIIVWCFLAGILTAVGLFACNTQVKGIGNAGTVTDTVYSQETMQPAALQSDPGQPATVPPSNAEPLTEVTISAVGDCTLGFDYRYAVNGRFDTVIKNQKYDYGYCFSKVLPFFSADDLTIANLETTLTRSNQRINKGTGRAYWFKGDPAYTEILKKGSVEAAFFANNHSWDYGSVGFNDTLKNLEQAGIVAFGYDRKMVISIKGINVALLGYNLVDYIEKGVKSGTVAYKIAQDIKSAKENNQADLVIVNCHWGMEGKTTQDKWQVAVAHAAIDSGADLVLGHHPHVIQGVERYNGKMIVYSMGNFCFGGNRNPQDKDTFIYQQAFSFNKDKQCVDYSKARVIPCMLSSSTKWNDYCPMPVEGELAAHIHNRTGY